MAFIIFYCDRKGNANLNLGRRVQEAYSSTEGFSNGINLVLSMFIFLTLSKTHDWCPGCSERTCLYGFAAKHSAKKEAS